MPKLRKFYHFFNFCCGCFIIGFGLARLFSMYWEGIDIFQVLLVLASWWCCGHFAWNELISFCVIRKEKNIYDFGYTPGRYGCFYEDRR